MKVIDANEPLVSRAIEGRGGTPILLPVPQNSKRRKLGHEQAVRHQARIAHGGRLPGRRRDLVREPSLRVAVSSGLECAQNDVVRRVNVLPVFLRSNHRASDEAN